MNRHCIFCLKRSVSNEHVFPIWLQEFFPRTPNDSRNHQVTSWETNASGRIRAAPVSSRVQGHPGSKKVPYVCVGCNTGWMSRLEQRTRPLLIPLIEGRYHRISKFDQKVLATWFAKTAMVAEFMYPTRTAIPDSDRLFVLAELEAPAHWSIWIADYVGTKWRNLSLYHQICTLPPGAGAPPKPLIPDTQFTSIGIGRLFAHVASSTDGEFVFTREEQTPLRRIWPPQSFDVSWPPNSFMDDELADRCAGGLSHILGIPRSIGT